MPVITAQSTPDYDQWGWDSYWSCTDWITWHQALEKEFGRSEANRIAQAAWDQQDFFEHNRSWCKYNQDFVKYFKSVGLGGDQSFTSMAYETVYNVGNAGINVSETVQNISELIKKMLPIILIVVVILGILYVNKKAQIL